MSRLNLGRHWPADSFWHRRDPLVKLLLALALIGPVVAARSWDALLAAAVLLLVLWTSARLPGRLFLGALRAFSWLILLTLFANLFLAGNAGPVWPPRMDGLALAGRNALRLVLLFAAGAWLTGTTSPLSLTGSLGRAFAPLGSLGVPVGDLALMAGLGLRLLPDLLEAGERVRLAQRARGVGAGRGWRVRLAEAEALAVALFAYAFRRADELALAMEARGYRPGKYPVANGRARLSMADWLALAGALGATILLFVLGRG